MRQKSFAAMSSDLNLRDSHLLDSRLVDRAKIILLSRKRSWCVSTDPQFIAKSTDIIGLYLNPPFNAIVIPVGKKPSMQAPERQTGIEYYNKSPRKMRWHITKLLETLEAIVYNADNIE